MATQDFFRMYLNDPINVGEDIGRICDGRIAVFGECPHISIDLEVYDCEPQLEFILYYENVLEVY